MTLDHEVAQRSRLHLAGIASVVEARPRPREASRPRSAAHAGRRRTPRDSVARQCAGVTREPPCKRGVASGMFGAPPGTLDANRRRSNMHGHILVVEDDIDTATLACEGLRKRGFSAQAVPSAEE